ncbi:MAG: 4Fe-4S ferredoxin, partial [Deltaproteobacteria bacterium]|nr:4Fe-4S ferredoxin [Deltaproteobacteria bacterium]
MTDKKVYFSDMRASSKENHLSKLVRLLNDAGLEEIIAPRSLAAIKLHFGERGNTAFIRPLFIRAIV